MRSRSRRWLGLGVSFLLVAAVALFGRQFMPGEWYAGLEKPAWTPPSWIFGPVWTTLYIAMALAAWLVWRTEGSRAASRALVFYFTQLVLNALWSWLFFGAHEIGFALLDLAMLWLALAVTLVLFWRRNRLAGALLLPYLAWISFAGALNFSLWRLN